MNDSSDVIYQRNKSINLHPHWLRFIDDIENVSETFITALGVYITVVGFVGTVGNFIVVYIFCSTSSLRTPANVLVVNLALCDLFFSMVAGFPMMSLSCFYGRWIWGHTGCKMYAFLTGLTGLASINCLAAISFDRYLVVVHPLFMLDKSSSKRVVLNLSIIWLWAALWTIPPMVGWGDYIIEGFGVSCTFDYLTTTPTNVAYNYCLVCCGFFIPLLIIVASYYGIVVQVKRCRKNFTFSKTSTFSSSNSEGFNSKRKFQRKLQPWSTFATKADDHDIELKSFEGKNNSLTGEVSRHSKNKTGSQNSKERQNSEHQIPVSKSQKVEAKNVHQRNVKQELKITKVLATCIASFCVCWLPYAIVTQLAINGFQDYVTPYMAELPVMLAKSSAIWNPIIYSLNHPRYIQALKSNKVIIKVSKIFGSDWADKTEKGGVGSCRSKISLVA